MTANQAMSPIQTMCKAFGVSRAGYYAWHGRQPSARSRADADLMTRIKAIHKASRETYGAPISMRAWRNSNARSMRRGPHVRSTIARS